MRISDITSALTCVEVYNNQDVNITGFSIDTRLIRENSVFVGMIGDKFDGGDFYKSAFEKGAVCAIVNKRNINEEEKNYLVKNNKTIIVVEDTIKAFKEIAVMKRSSVKVPIIAITGSAGKTSTKDLVHSVLNAKYRAFKTIGNKNNHIGLPLTLSNLKDEEIVVLEMGMNHLGEIDYLTNIAKPNIAVITNVGTAHIGILGSQENILKAKLEIINGLEDNGTVIINNDDELLNKWANANKNNYNVKTFGVEGTADITAKDVNLFEDYATFEVDGYLFTIPVSGIHYVYNALPAILVGKMHGLTNEEINSGLSKLELSSNRMELTTINNINYINDAYNSNYDAVKASLSYLKEFDGRKIACLGTMKELGDFSKELHTKLGKKIIENNVDILITVGEYTDYIIDEAVKLGFDKDNAYNFTTNNEAIKFINEIKKENDTILIKASLSCNFVEIVSGVKK